MPPQVSKGPGGIWFIEKFVWDPIGYKKMQNQPSIHAYMRAQAEMLEAEMKRLTSGPQRSAEDYREHSRFSQAYNIGTSSGYTLRDAIAVEGPETQNSIDNPFAFNIGVHNYDPSRTSSPREAVLSAIRHGRSDNAMQGRDFIKDAVRNVFGDTGGAFND